MVREDIFNMGDHRYTLEKGSKKHLCPRCGQNRFVRYVDDADHVYLPELYGRCDRESSCGYHLNPYTDGYKGPRAQSSIFDNKRGINSMNIGSRPLNSKKSEVLTPQSISYIPFEDVKRSRRLYQQNHFTLWLTTIIGPIKTSEVISRYHIGTSKHWPGATVFWQIDQEGKVRSGKIMLYDADNGHRIKTPFPHITWVHKLLPVISFNLEQCFFGEHLLKLNPNLPVCIVESEKTAIIASVYLPHLLWLAAGSLSNLTITKFRGLKSRRIFLFPDLNGYDKWRDKANEIRVGLPGINILVSDLLQKGSNSSDVSSGLDLADYLIKYNCKDFIAVQCRSSSNYESDVSLNPISSAVVSEDVCISESSIHEFDKIPEKAIELWPVSSLEKFFLDYPLPEGKIKLNDWTTITNIHQFIDSHLEIVKVQNGKPVYRPYFDRLNLLKEYLQCFSN